METAPLTKVGGAENLLNFLLQGVEINKKNTG